MAKDNALRRVTRKKFNWYGSVSVPAGSEKVNVVARVEELRPVLLEGSVLRVDVLVHMFVILLETNMPGLENTAASVDKNIQQVCFIQLREVHDFNNVVSLQHDITVDRVSVRMGRVSVVGSINMEVVYLAHVVLEGTVKDFPRHAPVPKARVTVRDAGTGEVLYSTTTDRDGGYVFHQLTPGTYRVGVEAEGYRGTEQVAVVMLHDRVNFTLHRA